MTTTRKQAFAAQAAWHASWRATAPKQVHEVGASVIVDGWTGLVIAFDGDKIVLGNRGFYEVQVTGGVDLFGKPATLGQTRLVLHSNVLAA